MTATQKTALVVVGALIAGAIVGLLLSGTRSSASQPVGGVYNQVQQNFDNGGFHVGAGGSNVSLILMGTCNPTQYTLGAFPASTTAQFYCNVTGVRSGDYIDVTPPIGAGANLTGAGSLGGGFTAIAAYATTSDRIGMTFRNDTGASTTTFPQATTTWVYQVFRTY